MDNQTIYSKELVDLLLASEEISKRMHANCITSTLALSMLARRPASPFRKYLIKKGANKDEIAKKIYALLKIDLLSPTFF